MPKSIALGNGNVLLLLDQRGQLRDFYFPFVGHENQVGGKYIHRVGVSVDNRFLWFDDPSWEISVNSENETLETKIQAINRQLHIQLNFNDLVYNEKNIFVRKIQVQNLDQNKHAIKIFFDQEFELYESHRGDTAYYDPYSQTIIHYKGRRAFLINARIGDKGFDDYSVGLFGIEGKVGTHIDAEDSTLTKNPIEHGLVDSVIRLTLDLEPQSSQTVYYWITAGKSIKEVLELNTYVLTKTPDHIMKTTKDFWYAWVNREDFNFSGLHPDIISLFKKSLFILRAHVDYNGSILASGDSDMLQKGRDTYSYMWPRDGAYSAISLAKAGDVYIARRFFEFCNDVISDDGYLMHKYRPDKSLGSSWHPWVRNGKPELPIQEDETALVIYALWKYYEISKDLEFIEGVYNSLIQKAADFMCAYIDPKTGLPKPSYDLWEEKFGSSTYTAATVYAALHSAANFAGVLGKTESQERYTTVANSIRDAILSYLYDTNEGIFIKMVYYENDTLQYDKTLDASSMYGILKFHVLPADDQRVKKFIDVVIKRLSCNTSIGGIARFEQDQYYKISNDIPGNPWFITTLWVVQYYIMIAKYNKDFDIVRNWLLWVVKYALPTGVLSEQINPFTGEQLSAAPLTWSQSEFVITVIMYLEKLKELHIRTI